MKNLLIISFLLCVGLNGFGQEDITKSNDSTIISNIVNDFYDWYLISIKEKKNVEFQPQFIENDKGMTTLDFTKYIENLKKYHFSDSLINAEVQSYQKCISHLEKTKYSEFESWTDLDDFESTNCDFGNYYRWASGQEPIDGIIIHQITNEGFFTLVKLKCYETGSNGERYYWGNKKVKLKNQNNEWFISSIK